MTLITLNDKKNVFHLSNQWVSYVFSVEDKQLIHKYFGKKIHTYSGGMDYPEKTRSSFSPDLPFEDELKVSLDAVLQEFPGSNQGDYRSSGIEVVFDAHGNTNTKFEYESHSITKGVIPSPGLPSSFDAEKGESETLAITLRDEAEQVDVTLYYTIFEDSPTIVRKCRINNKGQASVKIDKLVSMSLDFPAATNELIHLSGSWAQERQVVREKINRGIKVLRSKRGSSSHNQNPFCAIVQPTTTEESGEVYGFSFVYSGDHETIIEKDSFDQLRIQMGINHETFSWVLESGDEFYTPEVIMTFSPNGLNGFSQEMHDFVTTHIVKSSYKEKHRPVLMNNWEATYMAFDEETIHSLMEEGAKLGVELFVLDDGWFGKRNDDTGGLGDWWVNETKLPNGLKGLATYAKNLNMSFGLWFEPEMVSPKSDLYKKHPDWVLHYEKKGMSPARNQYMLDLTRQDVRDYLYTSIEAILMSADISYVKWDMNRNFSETYAKQLSTSKQKEVSHRYVLGLYELLERLTTRFPDILFESCSGGGGRFDLGMLYYMPQTWTSDNTDPVERLRIQYGTSLVYPISTMGSHVSASPNHQNGRMTSIDTRGHVAMSGLLGYELDLLRIDEDEKEAMRKQIDFYKKHRDLIQYGTFYRLLSPFEGDQTAWMFVSKDKQEAIVFYCNGLASAAPSLKKLKLQGLLENQKYVFDNGVSSYGSELMNMGFYSLTKGHQDILGDFATSFSYLKGLSE